MWILCTQQKGPIQILIVDLMPVPSRPAVGGSVEIAMPLVTMPLVTIAGLLLEEASRCSC